MTVSIDPNTIGFLIGDLSRLIRAEIERRIGAAGLGVTAGEGRALANIARMAPVRQNALAEQMGLEAMTLSGYLDRLEARGLVTREPDPADRRAKLVRLTDSADEALLGIKAIGGSLREDLSRQVSARDWTTTMKTLASLRDRLTEMRAENARKEGRAA